MNWRDLIKYFQEIDCENDLFISPPLISFAGGSMCDVGAFANDLS